MPPHRENARGSLSHHGGAHAADPGKAMDSLFDKVILGVLILVAIIGALVFLI